VTNLESLAFGDLLQSMEWSKESAVLFCFSAFAIVAILDDLATLLSLSICSDSDVSASPFTLLDESFSNEFTFSMSSDAFCANTMNSL
jgi:hypothetical protein